MKTLEELQAETVALQNENEELTANVRALLDEARTLRTEARRLQNPGVDDDIAEAVAQKMADGLDRETAIRAAKAQKAWDAEQGLTK